jgi:hypothetical protein
MFFPRFSIRWLLGLTTFSAFVSLVLSYSVRGHAWAIGVVAGLWTFVIAFALFATAFLAAWLISRSPTNLPQTATPPPPPGDQPTASPAIDLPPPITG